MQRLTFFVLLLSFALNGSAQNFLKDNNNTSNFQFDNHQYKVTWIIKNGKYGLLDTKNRKFIVPPTYEYAEIYDENYSLIKQDGFYGFINHTGHLLTGIDYKSAKYHNEKLILVEKDGKYTFLSKTILTSQNINFTGNPELSEEYDMVISSYTDEFSIVILGAKYGYINDIGEEIIPPMYDDATLFDGQFAAVKIGSKWGAVDKSNGKVIDFQYANMKPFNSEKCVAKKGSKWGIIDGNNKIIIPFKYKYLSNFNSDSVAIAKKGKSWGVINMAGKIIIDFNYKFDLNYLSLMQLTDGYLWLQKNGFWGTVDLKNNVIIPFIYDEIQSIDGSEITVVKDNRNIIIDEFGNCIKNCPRSVNLENQH
ncbi:MAG: hypothetical protein ACJAUH_000643 [Saprospiraceae bacterium]|jgi:hypothetical protein